MLNTSVRRNTVRDMNRKWNPFIRPVAPWQITLSSARYLSERLFSEHPDPESMPVEHCASVMADCEAYAILFNLTKEL